MCDFKRAKFFPLLKAILVVGYTYSPQVKFNTETVNLFISLSAFIQQEWDCTPHLLPWDSLSLPCVQLGCKWCVFSRDWEKMLWQFRDFSFPLPICVGAKYVFLLWIFPQMTVLFVWPVSNFPKHFKALLLNVLSKWRRVFRFEMFNASSGTGRNDSVRGRRLTS